MACSSCTVARQLVAMLANGCCPGFARTPRASCRGFICYIYRKKKPAHQTSSVWWRNTRLLIATVVCAQRQRMDWSSSGYLQLHLCTQYTRYCSERYIPQLPVPFHGCRAPLVQASYEKTSCIPGVVMATAGCVTRLPAALRSMLDVLAAILPGLVRSFMPKCASAAVNAPQSIAQYAGCSGRYIRYPNVGSLSSVIVKPHALNPFPPFLEMRSP